MQGNRKKSALLFWLLSIFLFACATHNAPRGWLSNPAEMAVETCGGWIEINFISPGKIETQSTGELIAISKDSIYIANEKLMAIAISDITSAKLVGYNSHASVVGIWSFLGTLSTISNGGFLIFTAPMWIIGGSISAHARSMEPILQYPKQSLDNFAPFARFPQGIPERIDRNKIIMKHVQ